MVSIRITPCLPFLFQPEESCGFARLKALPESFFMCGQDSTCAGNLHGLQKPGRQPVINRASVYLPAGRKLVNCPADGRFRCLSGFGRICHICIPLCNGGALLGIQSCIVVLYKTGHFRVKCIRVFGVAISRLRSRKSRATYFGIAFQLFQGSASYASPTRCMRVECAFLDRG